MVDTVTTMGGVGLEGAWFAARSRDGGYHRRSTDYASALVHQWMHAMRCYGDVQRLRPSSSPQTCNDGSSACALPTRFSHPPTTLLVHTHTHMLCGFPTSEIRAARDRDASLMHTNAHVRASVPSTTRTS